jgi:hypothetical protein
LVQELNMQIQVNTDKNIEGRDELVEHVKQEIEEALSRFSERLTRVEVHLGDESSGRSTGEDQRCTIEARPAGQAPVAVTHHAAAQDLACRGAVDKLGNLLESRFARQDHRKGGDSVRTADQPESGDAPLSTETTHPSGD